MGFYGGGWYGSHPTGSNKYVAEDQWSDPNMVPSWKQEMEWAYPKGIPGMGLAPSGQYAQQPSAPTAPAPAAAPDTPTFNYPMPGEVADQVYGLPWMQQQQDRLGQMGSFDAYQSAMMPQIQDMMKGLGRSGLPSSSYADRGITNTLGGLWNNWQWNVLQGYQDIGRQMPMMMEQWYRPYNNMMGMVAG